MVMVSRRVAMLPGAVAGAALLIAAARPAVALPALIAQGIAVFAAIMWRGRPLPQDLAYHRFVDQRTCRVCSPLLSVPNASDVVSNIVFFVFGVDGVVAVAQPGRIPLRSPAAEYPALLTLFVSVTMVAFGSAYYHWRPCNRRLVWDRLPMSFGFASVIYLVVCERVPVSVAWLCVLVVISATSVIYWAVVDDLRPYLFVQFYGIVFLIQVMAVLPSLYTHASLWPTVLAVYVLAKIAEVLDAQIFRWTKRTVSGHTVKHLLAGVIFKHVTLTLKQRRLLTG
ncbi:Ceramidase [Plasmodiophora brassicae]